MMRFFLHTVQEVPGMLEKAVLFSTDTQQFMSV